MHFDGWDDSCDEIVEYNRVRPPANTPTLTPDMYQQAELPIPADARQM